MMNKGMVKGWEWLTLVVYDPCEVLIRGLLFKRMRPVAWRVSCVSKTPALENDYVKSEMIRQRMGFKKKVFQ